MATKLIVPLDMSSTAERALPLAQTLASQLSAEVVLISVIEVSPDLDDFVGTKEFKEDVVRLQRDLSQYLESKAFGFNDVPVDTVIRMGSAVDEISMLVDGLDDAALVISSHGRSGIKRYLIGSVAMRLIHQAQCPVFVVTATSGEKSLDGPVQNVLAPLDGSPLSESALTMVSGMFGPGWVNLHVIRVSELGAWRTMPYTTLDYYGDDRYFEAAQRAVGIYLDDIKRRLDAEGQPATVEPRAGVVSEQIRLAARENHADIIAMATHGRTGLNRMIMGSEAERVVRESPVPVLLQRPANTSVEGSAT